MQLALFIVQLDQKFTLQFAVVFFFFFVNKLVMGRLVFIFLSKK